MSAQQQLCSRIAALAEADVAVIAGFVEDALPPQFRSAPSTRPNGGPCSREQLLREVELLTEDEAREVIEYLDWITSDEPEDLSAAEWADVRDAERRMARGEYISLDDLKRDLGL